MKQKVSRSSYEGRSARYYITCGGVFTELNDVLEEMYADQNNKGMQQPVQILNHASFWKDRIEADEEEGMSILEWLPADGDKLMLCVLACIAPNNMAIQQSLKPVLVADDVYYPKFQPIMDKWAGESAAASMMKQNEALVKKVDELTNKVEMQRGVISFYSQAIDYLLKQPSGFPYDLGHVLNWSGLDRCLTFSSVMDWIKTHPYSVSRDVISMLEQFMDIGDATEEQRTQLREVKEELMQKAETLICTNQNISQGGIIFANAVDSPVINTNKK